MTVWKVIVHYAFLTVLCHRLVMTSPSFPIKVINIYKKTEKNAFQHSLCHQFHSVAFQLFSSFSILNLIHPVTSSTTYSTTRHIPIQCIIRLFFSAIKRRSSSPERLCLFLSRIINRFCLYKGNTFVYILSPFATDIIALINRMDEIKILKRIPENTN